MRLKRGDCKDYAALTTAILIKLGYKAHMALVFRGVHSQYGAEGVGEYGHRNHVVVKIVGQGGRYTGLTPTTP